MSPLEMTRFARFPDSMVPSLSATPRISRRVERDRLQPFLRRQAVRDRHRRLVGQVARVVRPGRADAEPHAGLVQLRGRGVRRVVRIAGLARQGHDRPEDHRHVALLQFSRDLPRLDPAAEDRLHLQLVGELQSAEDVRLAVGREDDRLLAADVRQQRFQPRVGRRAPARPSWPRRTAGRSRTAP